ncbi:AbfB domain-containing protein [Micromonospora sp. CPCC 206061]|uniref:AbfB domain-containing protein n=1 Tax=Micromonospora sp. CPCC 206061 TaxID=3122410 RepID=UPI002FF3BC53
MSNEDITRHRLRVGGWLPSFDGDGQARPGNVGTDLVRYVPPPGVATHSRAFLRRRLAIAGVTVVVFVVAATVASFQRGGVAPATSVSAGPDYLWPQAEDLDTSAGLGTAEASPPGAPTTAAVDGTGRPAAPGRTTDGGGGVATPATPPPAATPPTVSLTVGASVGLEPVTHSGYRVRHRNFAGRIDPIGSGSSSVDKADATFRVRRGLASNQCYSLESTNYPGYYLRHQNFRVYLHRADGSQLFAADATFCAATGLAGQHTSLRSLNYPDRYLNHRSSELRISTADDSSTRRAATFVIRAPF